MFYLQLGLDALHKSGVVASLEPTVELQFQKTRPVVVYCRLRRRDVPDVMLDRYITVTNKDKVRTFRINTHLILMSSLFTLYDHLFLTIKASSKFVADDIIIIIIIIIIMFSERKKV